MAIFQHILVFVVLGALISLLFVFRTLRNQINENKIIKELHDNIGMLERKIVGLEMTIDLLMEKIALPEQDKQSLRVQVSSRPVLLVFGDERFGNNDRNALRRAGVPFFRLTSTSLEDLERELQRRRSENRLYDVVHIAAHSSENIININRDFVTGRNLSNALSGVRCLFLSTCSNSEIADDIVGIVKYVITIYEAIEDNDASNFAYEFYKRYKEAHDIEEAFNGAIAVMPHISEFVDLRIGG